MHEVSLVAELVDAAIARAGDRPVEAIRVRRATTIPEDVLDQAFAMLVTGTPLDGAALEVEVVEVRLACECGFDGVLEHDDVLAPSQAICPSCGELRSIPRSPELALLEVRTRGAS